MRFDEILEHMLSYIGKTLTRRHLQMSPSPSPSPLNTSSGHKDIPGGRQGKYLSTEERNTRKKR